MKVRDLLRKQSGKLVTCRPDTSVPEVAALLTEKRIGAVPVLGEKQRLVGVLSERDLARGIAEYGAQVIELAVRDLMTREVTVCAPADSVREAMFTMSRLHIRHLPVVDEGALVGIISQRDVLKALLDQTELEVSVLRDYARAKP
ncbi:MAG: CBS domain-containing protein [Deferrisomatales bacterium]